jgi:hypothetical protein
MPLAPGLLQLAPVLRPEAHRTADAYVEGCDLALTFYPGAAQAYEPLGPSAYTL